MKKSTEQDVAEIIGKMQEQLVSLEKKIDVLINRPSAQSSRGSFHPPRHNDRMQQGHDYRQRDMHKVICADCNKECEIPFKPSSARPVYCRECFSRRKNSSNIFKPRQQNPVIERDFTLDRASGKKRKSYDKKKKGRK